MALQTWFVYLLYSVRSGRLLTGTSTNPHQGLSHQTKPPARGTSPWKIVWTRRCDGRSDAVKLEALIKRMSRQEKLVLAGLSA